MADNGLHFWDETNKVTDEPLQIRYAAKYGGSLGGRKLEGKAYEYHRYASKTYRYVGMDERTARACAEAKLAQYTRVRFFWYWETMTTLNFSRELKAGATVKARHTGGHLWSVEIQVNEDDVYYSPLWIDDIAAAGVFAGGDYDEPAPAPGAVLMIRACYWLSASPHNLIYVSYSADVDGFTPAKLSAEYSVNGRDWFALSPSSTAADFNAGVWCIGNDGTSGAGAFPSAAALVRIKYGSLTSNAAIVPSAAAAFTGAITLAAPAYVNGYWRINYNQDAQGFAASRAVLQTSADGEVWTAAPSYIVTATDVNTGDKTEASAAVRWWRLVFNDSISNAVSVGAAEENA